MHYLDFEEEPGLSSLFEKDLKPKRILDGISLHLHAPIDPNTDLLVFDEIQNAPKALTALKYFSEEIPGLALCCAGSLLGLHLNESSFPAGKVEFLDVHPMTFGEFLRAIGEESYARILEYYDFAEPLPELVHAHLWDALNAYFIVGGLPEAVATYAELRERPFEAFAAVRKKQRDLITAYLADVAKHSGKINSMHIERVWRSVPAQLAREQDGSSAKFRFNEVGLGLRGYARLAGAIDWLKTAGLIRKLPIANKAWIPLPAYTEESVFKLYPFDVGLLGALGGIPPKALHDFSFGSYKGYVAENFVLQELSALDDMTLAAWKENTAEVEFLVDLDGKLIPVEVKSGWVTQAKSLKVFVEKYGPAAYVTLGAGNFSKRAGGGFRVPLYMAGRIRDLARGQGT